MQTASRAGSHTAGTMDTLRALMPYRHIYTHRAGSFTGPTINTFLLVKIQLIERQFVEETIKGAQRTDIATKNTGDKNSTQENGYGKKAFPRKNEA